MICSIIFITTSIISITSAAHEKKPWNYENGADGPVKWTDNYEDCKRNKQSPIDIVVGDTRYKRMAEFMKNDAYYKNDDGQFTLGNNGHSITASLNEGVAAKELSGGGLPNSYKLLQFHMHWGNYDKSGSEHSIDKKHYPMEIHFVHMNTKYTTLKDAGDKEGLAVYGVMVKIGKLPHPGFQKIVDVVDQIKYKDQSTLLNASFSVTELMSYNTELFYRYSGSLTTPPCSENVIWSLMKHPMYISREQMDKFREIYSTKEGNVVHMKISGNYRPIQPMKGRRVYRSFLMEKDLNGASAESSTLAWGLTLIPFIYRSFFN